jgi:hypothetical protein
MRFNLLSVSSMAEEGVEVHVQDKMCTILDASGKLMLGQ